MEAVLQVVQRINFYLSDYILVFLLIGTGLYFSVRTRFVQVRCFGEGMRSVFGEFNMRGGRQKGGLSSFQALTTAIAAQVGTGNIIGACGAILLGGPGAIFWMWIIAFFGMATIYAEAVLAQETRRVAEDGSVSGGPVYYIKRAFPGRFGTFLAGFFAVALILALGFMGCMVQSNSIGETCAAAFGVPSWAVGIAVAVLAAVVFLGGIQRIAGVTEKLVPVMAALYLLGGLVVLVCRIRYLPEAVGMIFRYAFVPNAIIGGSLGYALKMAVSQGVKRGLFSNEAGMGSTPHAHAMAKVKHDGAGGDLHPVCRKRYPLRRGGGGRQQGQHGAAGLRHGAGQPGRQYVRGGVPAVLRLFHHPQLELLRAAQRIVAAGGEGRGGVFGAGHRVHLSGLVPVQRLGMGAGGSIQPADGAAQRTGAGDAGRTGGSGLPEEVTAAGTGDRPRFSVFCP